MRYLNPLTVVGAALVILATTMMLHVHSVWMLVGAGLLGIVVGILDARKS